ncbi:MAG: FAD-dependent oxidoreductase [Patescibacteria group bacterium]|nr:FAD-dependent oxidoreductase [Patescibacteria group bacterium]MCL5431862.1 FAD-dependent oxidoreductase [Patescibacteria group bacterium]
MEIYDVAIIGSGPAGLTAAIYASRANLKTVVTAGSKWGGQLMLTTTVENFPGFPDGIQGPELMEKMKTQAEKFGTKIIYEDATTVEKDGNLFAVNSYQAKSVIIASGANTMWLNLPNEQRLIGHGVSSCAPCDAFFFKGKKVAVVGGGDSAMEEALVLTKFASEVTIIHRRDAFRASKIMQERVLDNPKIKVMFNSRVTDVLGTDKVEGLKIEDCDLNENWKLKIENFPVDGLFVAIGHKPNDELLKNFPDYPNLPDGLFIAGDVIDAKYKQAITAAAAGCQAAMDAEKWLDNQPKNSE